jgi:hypothetical protein
MAKWIVVAVFILASIALFPLSLHVAGPLFTRPCEEHFHVPVLLVFPDHVDVRWVNNIAEVAPPPNGASYTFAIPRDRQQWVEQQIRLAPPPRPGSFWRLRINQLDNDTQRVELEAYRDGFTGLIYDARKTSISPVAYRKGGPGAALVYLLIDLALSCALSVVTWVAVNFAQSQRSRA